MSSSTSRKRPRAQDGADSAALAKAVAPVACTVATASNPSFPSSSSSSSAASKIASAATATANATPPLPLGNFDGQMIYRNSMNARESLELGHVSLQDLIPLGTARCLCTTFISAGGRWMDEVFRARVDRLLVIRHDPRYVDVKGVKGAEGGQRKVGNAILEPIEVDDDDVVVANPNWHWLQARPSSGGILHSKILLFRTKEGLRVVVTGSNLCDQWTGDRDVLWVQDFPLLKMRGKQQQQQPSSASTVPAPQQRPGFEQYLREFVQDITGCGDSFRCSSYVQKFASEIFDGINFAPAAAELVYSFPREAGSDKKPGGWPMLAQVVSRLKGQHEQYPDTDDEDDYDGAGVRDDATNIYVAAGCLGNLTPSFLLQMYRAMNGETRQVEPNLSWDRVPRGVKVLWPSTKTATSLLPTGIINTGGPMPLEYWRTIPLGARRKILHEGKPSTPVSGLAFPDLGFDPVVHGKSIFATPRVASSTCPQPSFVYVGSHNFSAAAFGDEHGSRPRNIEMGVVLATADQTIVKEWIKRLPCALPTSEERPPNDGYIPMTAHSGIKNEWNEAYDAGDAEGRKRAEEKLMKWLSRVEEGHDNGEEEASNGKNQHGNDEKHTISDIQKSGQKAAAAMPKSGKSGDVEVVDLCSDSE